MVPHCTANLYSNTQKSFNRNSPHSMHSAHRGREEDSITSYIIDVVILFTLLQSNKINVSPPLLNKERKDFNMVAVHCTMYTVPVQC